MSEFDPTKPSLVHDSLNDKTFEGLPAWAENYREHAIDAGKGAIG